MSLIKKITIANVVGEFDVPKVKTILCVIGGIVTNASEKTTDYGVSWKFTGQFKAINAATGETFESAVLYAPDVIADALAAAVVATREPVEFSVKVGVVPDKTSATKYVYFADPVREVTAAPAMLLIEKEMRNSLGEKPAKGKDAQPEQKAA